MRLAIRFIALLILGIFCSCTENLKKDSKVIVADLNNVSSFFDEDVIDSVTIISLQSCDTWIQRIDKVVEFDSKFYMMDQKSRTLLIFSQEGTYLCRISNIGHATNEYIGISDFFIDKQDSTINIVSSLDKKVLKYSLNGTKLLEVQHMPKSFHRLACYDGGYVGFMGNCCEGQPYSNFWMMDKDFHILNSYLNINPNFEGTFHGDIATFSEYDSKLFFLTDESREISCISRLTSTPSVAYNLDCGEANPPSLTANDYSDWQRMFELSNKYVMDIYRFQETDDYLITYYLYQGSFYITMVDKTSNETKTLSLDAYSGDYLFEFGRIVSMTEDFIYTSVEAQSVYYPWKGNNGFLDFEKEYPLQVENIRRRFSDIDPDGNPFLVKYHIKKHGVQ